MHPFPHAEAAPLNLQTPRAEPILSLTAALDAEILTMERREIAVEYHH
jgi:hypothetical protein